MEKRVDAAAAVPLVAAVHGASVPLAPGGDVQSELVSVELGSWPSQIAASEIETFLSEQLTYSRKWTLSNKHCTA